jgi:peroxiredoxin
VVAVSVDDPGNEDRIRRFVAEHALSFEVLNEGSGRIETDYQSPGIPSTFLIDRDGVIRQKVMGATDWSAPERREAVARLLRSPGAAPR